MSQSKVRCVRKITSPYKNWFRCSCTVKSAEGNRKRQGKKLWKDHWCSVCIREATLKLFAVGSKWSAGVRALSPRGLRAVRGRLCQDGMHLLDGSLWVSSPSSSSSRGCGRHSFSQQQFATSVARVRTCSLNVLDHSCYWSHDDGCPRMIPATYPGISWRSSFTEGNLPSSQVDCNQLLTCLYKWKWWRQRETFLSCLKWKVLKWACVFLCGQTTCLFTILEFKQVCSKILTNYLRLYISVHQYLCW